MGVSARDCRIEVAVRHCVSGPRAVSTVSRYVTWVVDQVGLAGDACGMPGCVEEDDRNWARADDMVDVRGVWWGGW